MSRRDVVSRLTRRITRGLKAEGRRAVRRAIEVRLNAMGWKLDTVVAGSRGVWSAYSRRKRVGTDKYLRLSCTYDENTGSFSRVRVAGSGGYGIGIPEVSFSSVPDVRRATSRVFD